MRGWQRMDRDIQRRIDEARASGDPERLQREIDFANESYGTGAGVAAGAIAGSLILPGIGTVVGAIIGGFIGNNVSK